MIGAVCLFIWQSHHMDSAHFPIRLLLNFDAWGYSDEGESLLHGISSGWSPIRMPLSSVLAALFFRHWGFSPSDWGILSVGLKFGLLFALSGMLLPGIFPVCLALGTLILADENIFLTSYMESGSSIFLLIVAGLLVWREQALSYRQSFLLSFAIGTSLLFRSPLVFFPPLLALFEGQRAPSIRSYWKHALILCIVPYLFLIPWVRMNWALHNRFIPLEYDAANVNIAAGALGFVTSMDGDWRQIVGPTGPDKFWTIWRWAASEIGRHPLRYLKAYAQRIEYVVTLHPALFLAAFLTLCLYRQKREFQVLGLMVLYYVGIYCSMAVVSRSFDPLVPVLAVLAACGPFALLKTKAIVPGHRQLARYVISLLLAIVTACALYAAAKVSLYAAQITQTSASSRELLDDAIRTQPQHAWLLFARGRRHLDAGNIPEAISDLSRAAAMSPRDPGCRLRLAWARMMRGNPQSLLAWPILPNGRNNNLNVDAHLFKAHAYLRMGRPSAAHHELKDAMESELLMTALNEAGTPRERGIIEQMRSAHAGFINKASHLLTNRPAREQLAMLGELAKLAPRDDVLTLRRVDLMLEVGQIRRARELLEHAGAGVDAQREGLRRVARSYQMKGDCKSALRLWDMILQDPHHQAKDFSDQSVCEVQ